MKTLFYVAMFAVCLVLPCQHSAIAQQAENFKTLDEMEALCANKKYKSCLEASRLFELLNNDKKAKEFFILACQYGSRTACRTIDKKYPLNDVGQTVSEAFLSAYIAQERAAVETKDFSGDYYRKLLTPSNFKKFKELSKGKDPYATTIIGEMYSITNLQKSQRTDITTGIKEKNHKKLVYKSSEYFSYACEKAVAYACMKLGSLFENGSFEHELNSKKAVWLYAKACRLGDWYGCVAHKYLSALFPESSDGNEFFSAENLKAELDRAETRNQQFIKLYDQGRYSEAITNSLLSLRHMTSLRGGEHIDVITILNNLGAAYQADGQVLKAEKTFLKISKIIDASFQPDDPDLAIILNNLGEYYWERGKYTIAKQYLERSLNIFEKSFKEMHPDKAVVLGNLGMLYSELGRKDKAEEFLVKALKIREGANPKNYASISTNRSNLAGVYRDIGQFDEALLNYAMAVATLEATSGENDPKLIAVLNNQAQLYNDVKDYAASEKIFLRLLDIHKKKGGELGLRFAAVSHNLGHLYLNQEKYKKAESYFVQALSVYEVTAGEFHPSTASILDSLGFLYYTQNQFSKSLPLSLKALKIKQAALGAEHPSIALTHGNLALLYRDKQNQELHKALTHIQAASAIFERRLLRSEGEDTRAKSGSAREIKINSSYFYTHAMISRLMANDVSERNLDLLADSFSSAQHALRTSAGTAMKQAAVRFSTSNGKLSDLIRNRQDLAKEWEALSETISDSINAIDFQRDESLEGKHLDRLEYIDAEIIEIDRQLEGDFPEYYTLTSPLPLSLKQTQDFLYDDEALVMFLSGDDGILVFAVTKDEAQWTLVDLSKSDLIEAVRVLRVAVETPQNTFPRDEAFGLYKKLMSEVEELVSSKEHVFITSSGALSSIPPSILVTERPLGDDRSPRALRKTEWWGTKQALTTLPSILSLKTLRGHAKGSHGNEPFAGFGNPILFGPEGYGNSKRNASQGITAYFRGVYANLAAIRSLSPLPQTEFELLSMAKTMGSDPEESLWLGARNTETNLKKTDLSKKRVIAFATHGLISGEILGLSEPALVFTPPVEATDVDDGLLTASEAALLNLNADWIVLSACNTAAAAEYGAEGLSGLSESFFYAGTRAMLVSHWPVRDDAAARLTTRAINLQYETQDLGRAEAMRRSMLDLMNDPLDLTFAHPSSWAPFVVIGEGAQD